MIELTGRKSIRRGIARIRGVDDRSVLLEFVPRQAGESDLLRVIRRRRHPSTGADSFEPVGLLG